MPDRMRDAASSSGRTGWNLRLQEISSRGLTIAAGIAALVLLANVPLNRRNTQLLADHGAALIYSYQVIGHLTEVLSLAKDAEAGTRGFVITGDETFLEPYNIAALELPTELNRLDSLTRNDSVQQARMPVLRARTETRLEWLRETARIRAARGPNAGDARVRTGVGKAQMDGIRDIVAEMRAHEEGLLQRRSGQAANAYRQVQISGILAALGAFLSFVALVLLVQRHFKARAASLQEILEQRAYFENTLRSIDDAVITTDEGDHVSGLNAAAVRLTGWTESEASGRSLDDVLVMHHAASGELADEAVRANAGTSPSLVAVETRQGNERLAELRQSAIRNGEGAQIGSIVVLTDVTESVDAESRLVESEGRFRSMADSAPVMIWVSDPAGTITYTNAQWRTFVGVDRAAPMDIACTLHPDDTARFTQMVAQLPNQRGPVTLEFRVCRADGRYRWMMCTSTPRLSETGAFLGGIGSILDIEERKVLENDLRLLAADLSASDRRKDEFLATLAHELRNPLAPIRNGLEILRLALPPNDTIDRTRGMMERQLVQIVRLVDDLLDISRISSGKLSLQRARIDLRDAIALAIEATAATRTSRSQRIVYEAPPSAVPVDGDLARLGQVFTNLLDNAAKYSPPHGLVWLSLHTDATSVEVRVRDRGHGIPSAMLTDVFEMFTQVDHSLERSQGGLGIGLTLVKRMVEMHGGTVLAHSEGANQGSEFSVRLPLVTAASRVLLDGASPERSIGNGAQSILIADDNVDGATTLAMMLTARGHHVETANDGLSAVALAEMMQPTLVLLDIGMPGLNGYEVCQRLRATPWGEHATIVAITGWGQEHDRRRSAEAGFDYHIVKPVDPTALERLVQRAQMSTTSRATG